MQRTITVKGIGKASVKPDYIEISLKLEAKNKEYSRAMELAGEQLKKLSDALISIGFEKDILKTKKFRVDADYESMEDEDDYSRQVFIGFKCTHHLTISFDLDMDRLAQVLSTITKCMAKPELIISFTIKDTNAINEMLLCSAVSNSRKKAEVLCNASGTTLGQLLTITYDWAEVNYYSCTSFLLNESHSNYLSCPNDLEMEPDDINVKDTVTIVWAIE